MTHPLSAFLAGDVGVAHARSPGEVAP